MCAQAKRWANVRRVRTYSYSSGIDLLDGEAQKQSPIILSTYGHSSDDQHPEEPWLIKDT